MQIVSQQRMRMMYEVSNADIKDEMWVVRTLSRMRTTVSGEQTDDESVWGHSM